jgi:hypothetical protein
VAIIIRQHRQHFRTLRDLLLVYRRIGYPNERGTKCHGAAPGVQKGVCVVDAYTSGGH